MNVVLQDDVPPEVKRQRLNEIIELFRDQLAERKYAEIGKRHLVGLSPLFSPSLSGVEMHYIMLLDSEQKAASCIYGNDCLGPSYLLSSQLCVTRNLSQQLKQQVFAEYPDFSRDNTALCNWTLQPKSKHKFSVYIRSRCSLRTSAVIVRQTICIQKCEICESLNKASSRRFHLVLWQIVLGKTMCMLQVLTDSLARNGESWLGKTANMQRVKIEAEHDLQIHPGEYLDTEVVGCSGATLHVRVNSKTSTAEFVRQHGCVIPQGNETRPVHSDRDTAENVVSQAKAFVAVL